MEHVCIELVHVYGASEAWRWSTDVQKVSQSPVHCYWRSCAFALSWTLLAATIIKYMSHHTWLLFAYQYGLNTSISVKELTHYKTKLFH